MLTEIKRFFTYLLANEGEQLRKRILIFFLGIIGLVLINRFLFYQFVDNKDCLFSITVSELMVENDVNPYRSDISDVIVSVYPEEISNAIEPGQIFKDPVFNLFIYFPFSLIKNPVWSTITWITITQVLIVAGVFVFFSMVEFKSNLMVKFIFSVISLVFYFTIDAQINLSVSAIQIFSLLLVFKYSSQNQFVKAGIFFSLLFIQPLPALPVILVMVLILVASGNSEPVIWMCISLVLLSIAGMIFQMDWIPEYLQNVIFESPEFPFIGFGTAYFNAWGDWNFGWFLDFLPLIFIVWIALEWMRTPKQTLNQQLWIVSFTAALNPYLFVDPVNTAGIFYLTAILYILNLWETRSGGIFNIIIYGLTAIITIIFPLITRIFSSSGGSGLETNSINMIHSIFIVIMLYWVRWWIMRDYSEDNIQIS